MTFPLAVFDLDGTIADTNRDLIPALNFATAQEGLAPVRLDEVGHVVGSGAKAMIEKAFAMKGGAVSPSRLDELHHIFLEHYEANIADETVVFDHLIEQMDVLQNDGWRFAVCTNKFEHLSRKLLEELGIAHRYDVIAGADTYSVRKPDPGHILKTIEAAGGDPARAVMVGDSINDARPAQGIPIPIVLVDFGYSEHDVTTLGADAVLSSYETLADTVRGLVR